MKKRTHSQRIKEGIAKKKLLEANKAPLTPAVGLMQDMYGQQSPQQAAEDTRRNNEFHYRRGVVAVMECILRELR